MACFSNLPENCVSKILSLTSPKDACRTLVVSKEFQNLAESDVVWHQFLPPDFSHILSPTCVDFSSKKELFFFLSRQYILIDAGYKAFTLDKSTGRKSYILSARDLSILHGDVEKNWTWNSIQESRFGEVAELKIVHRLEIQGKIRAQTLTPNTKYGAYLIFKISSYAYGLDKIPCEVSIVSNGTVLTAGTARLSDPYNKKRHLADLFYGSMMQTMGELVVGEDEKMAGKREDGWLEIEVGEFFVGGSESEEEEIEMSVKEVKGNQLKGGLIVEGIEVRPKP